MHDPASREMPLVGFLTLLRKEVLRFQKVGFQTVLAPVLNAVLFMLIFSISLVVLSQAVQQRENR